jgi:SAM-dependent methyltransferase
MTLDLPLDVPRGGPAAPWWDRRLFETDASEYIDRPETDATCRAVLRGLDRFQRLTRSYQRFSRLTLAEVRDTPHPRILELGAGYGRLAQHLLDRHATARITVSDVNPGVVDALRSRSAARDPRLTFTVADATSIAEPDGAYDLAVMTDALHHLAPDSVAAALREGTRVARRFLIIDGWRNPVFLAVVPLMFLTGGWPQAHDGAISLRKVYSAAALHALAQRCGAPMRLRTRFHLPGYLVATVTRQPTRPSTDGPRT